MHRLQQTTLKNAFERAPARAAAREDVFDYIEMFYNPKRRHGFNEKVLPVNFEKRYF